jgi:hypothetical protein
MKIPRPAHCIENISVFLRLGMGRICAVVLVVIQRGLLVHIIDRSSSVDRILKRLRPVNDLEILLSYKRAPVSGTDTGTVGT